MSFNRFVNREQAKWSQPEIESCYMEAAEGGGFERLFDPEVPLEEKIATVDQMAKDEDEAVADIKATWDIYKAPGCPEEPDAPEIEVMVTYPSNGKRRKKAPCVFIVPCGGLACCMAGISPIQQRADAHNCVGVTFTYRSLYKGGKFPKMLNDCHAAYQFVVEHAEELGINPNKIVIEGDSSGGQLALSLAFRLKRYNMSPRAVMVYSAIVDDRVDWPSCGYVSDHWGGFHLVGSAREYLSEFDGPVPAEAYPNRATVEECVGLAPTFIHSFANDCSADPTLEFVSKLNEAGVFVTLHQWGGSNHDAIAVASIYAPGEIDTKYGRLFMTVFDAEIESAFEFDLSRPWTVEESGL